MTGRPAKKTAAKTTRDQGLSIILVQPQLGENIGMTARAMLNCGVIDLRLVNPRDNWHNDKTIATAVGADVVLDNARVFANTAFAVADLQLVYAATSRRRDMTKKNATPNHAASTMRQMASEGGRCGVIFGCESMGLNNDDIALADVILTVPMNYAFCSLNLSQSVLLVVYEWFQAVATTSSSKLSVPKNTRRANKKEMVNLFEHLEQELDDCGFLRVKEKRPIMVQNLRNMLQRSELTEQEVRTLHGVIAGLAMNRQNHSQ